jgi:ATP-dependent helicase/nuclease subunit A
MTGTAIKPATAPVRDIDPGVLQRRASNPEYSAFAPASAGAGKTKVLTDRMLRLMLPRDDARAGTKPEKILALTFTKAGASEMSLRLNKRLSEWVLMTPEKLFAELRDLFGRDPKTNEITAARTLFAQVMDAPGGLRIMTLHSFCQSVLGRFPLEAGLTPHFKPLEESEQARILSQARDAVLTRAAAEKSSPLSDSLHRIAAQQSEEDFLARLGDMMGERRQLETLLKTYFGVDGLYTALCAALDAPAGKTPDDMTRDFCRDPAMDEPALRRAVAALADGSEKTDQPMADKIQAFLDSPKRTDIYEEYKSVFLKKEGDIRKNLVTSSVQKKHPDILTVLSAEALRVRECETQKDAALCALLTTDLIRLGTDILQEYKQRKADIGGLDFDDLILRTLDLLSGTTMQRAAADATAWVMYKLDQGIDHILVDEAQDTNPEQWEIIRALCGDFFEGDTVERNEERTLFVVGDIKQSIFSFQRAAPDKFTDMQSWFEQKIRQAGKKFEIVPFNISFRSTPAVLRAVDGVMRQEHVKKGLGGDAPEHISFRRTQAGRVEIWPLFQTAPEDKGDFLSPPVSIMGQASGAEKLAAYLADTIAGWIGREKLESRDRMIGAGDIMILMRSRSAFVGQLVRALKMKNIPVNGVDRMVLGDQLSVQDLIAAAQFALLPEDDLSLACLLKSPLIGWDDDALLSVAHGRTGSLWQSIREHTDDRVTGWLRTLITRAGISAPYEFFSSILQLPCPADSVSGFRAIQKRLGHDAADPVGEFLNTAMEFERANAPSLQLFVQHHATTRSEIKREMEESGGAVRIMTVHGSKGLQAPIVILPDTIKTAQGRKPQRLLWPDRSGFPLPIFIPHKESAPAPALNALTNFDARQNDEERRLLYVAMTRAEDRLYITGYRGKNEPKAESWYHDVLSGFSTLPDVESVSFPGIENTELFRLSSPGTGKPDRVLKTATSKNTHDAPPEWLFHTPAPEPTPPRPLSPSRPAGMEPAAASPLSEGGQMRFVRGNVTHKLLQLLPDIAVEKRQNAAARYLAHSAHDLSADIQESIVREVIDILTRPEFTPLFGPVQWPKCR